MSALALATKSASKCIGCVCQSQDTSIRISKQASNKDLIQGLTPTPKDEKCSNPSRSPCKPTEQTQESKIARILRSEKLRRLREQELREVPSRAQDGMATPIPFIVRKLQKLRDMEASELRMKQLGESNKEAVVDAARGDTSKIAIMDVYSV